MGVVGCCMIGGFGGCGLGYGGGVCCFGGFKIFIWKSIDFMVREKKYLVYVEKEYNLNFVEF